MTAEGGYSPKDGGGIAWGMEGSKMEAARTVRGCRDAQAQRTAYPSPKNPADFLTLPQGEGGKKEIECFQRAMPKRAAIQTVAR